MISGGYYLKPRCIEGSKIANAPPHVREIWDWLIRKAVFDEEKKQGHRLERGQVFCTINEIREALHWCVGYRKEYYKKSSCENAMKWLLKEGMITTTKTTRGSIVTICNYLHYQNPKNYESRNESDNESRNAAGMLPNDSKECKNEKNVRIKLEALTIDHIADWLAEKRKEGKYIKIDEHALLEKFKNYCQAKGRVYKDYRAAFRNAFAWDNPPLKKETPARDGLEKIREAMR